MISETAMARSTFRASYPSFAPVNSFLRSLPPVAGIYIHIPFCRQACYYCDFHFSINLSGRTELVNALVREIEIQKTYLGSEPIETLYFGGGTPSLLTADELALIMQAVGDHFTLVRGPEITLEANPDDLTPDKLSELRSLGVNRLSIGIQSFNDSFLSALNRIHNATLARDSVRNAQRAGFDNISIDVIYAIPGMDIDEWRRNLKEAVQLDTQHISSYTLTVEDKTLFGKWTRQGKFHPVDDDAAADQHETMAEYLDGAGFEHYEVSNFSRLGYRSRHNTSYWLDRKYLGIGPGAHSYDSATRQYNVRNNRQYVASIQKGELPATREVLSADDKLSEYLLLSLRTSWGADLVKLNREFGFNPLVQRPDYMQQLVQRGFATVTGDALVLSRKGRLLADEIVASLLVDRSHPGP